MHDYEGEWFHNLLSLVTVLTGLCWWLFFAEIA